MTQFRFGSFVVDSDTIEVVGPDGVREVEPQVFNVLVYLVEQRGRLVTKEELLDNVWGDRFVSESALTTRIKQARRALDDDGTRQWAIKTVHGRGYRFLPEVETGQRLREAASDDLAGIEPSPLVLPEELQADARQLFFGREAELQRCEPIIDDIERDRFGWIWVLGEPGIGKTRLAAEIARLSTDRRHRVLFGRNGEDLRVPYQPFLEVLRPLVESGVATLPAAVMPLFPEAFGSEGGEQRPSSPADSDARRYEMFEAVAEWLVDLSSSAPITLVIDDVHWAADSTLQLLAHLQQRPIGGPVTFVLTSRDTAPDLNPRVADLIAKGNGLPATAVFRLGGLNSDEAVRLVGSELDIADVMRQTAGNPLLLQAVNHADGRVDMESAVRHRLAKLDEQVHETLRFGSVLGLEFELRVAAVATGRDELDLLDDLEVAVAARLLDDMGHDRFRFTHALVRSSLREGLSSSRQARLHRRIALAIDELFGDAPRYLQQLAYHTAKAAEVDNSLRMVAVDRLQRAAHESTAQFSFGEAAELLQRAQTLADPADIDLVARLLLTLGTVQSRAGENMTAARTLDEAIVAAREARDPALQIEAAIRYEDASWRPGLPGDVALERLREAEALLDGAAGTGALDNERELRARLSIAKLRALAMSGRRSEVRAAFDEAMLVAVDLGSANLEASALSVYLGQVLFTDGIPETKRMITRLAELEPMIDDTDVALHALHDRLLYSMLMGHFEERQELIGTMNELQERAHSSFWDFIRINQEAMEAFYRGDLVAAETLAQRCLELADALPEEDGSGTFGLRMFLIRREQDRLAAMAPLVRHVLASADADGIWTPGLALLLVETGATDEALAALAAVRANDFDLPKDSMWGTVMVLLIEAFVQLGDVEACTILRSRFTALAGTNVTTGSGLNCFGRAERYLGMLSLVIGDLDAAEHYLGTALEGDSAGGSVLWSNESRLWLSRVRRAQGHSAEADAMLEVVAREAESAGLARLERLAKAGSAPVE